MNPSRTTRPSWTMTSSIQPPRPTTVSDARKLRTVPAQWAVAIVATTLPVLWVAIGR